MVKYGLKLQKIGELLKEKRKARGLEHSQICEIIKIRTEYLKALENSDYTLFSSEVQAKGFLRKYAKYLGIEEEKAFALYRRERENGQNEGGIKSPSILTRGPNFVITPGKLVTALVVGTILAVLVYIGTQINQVVKPPVLTITSPVTVAAGEENTITVDMEEITLEGAVQVGSTLTFNGSEVATNNLDRYQIPNIKLKEGENKFTLVAESQFGKESEVTLVIIRQPKQQQVMNVTITPRENLFLTIISDNVQILNSNVAKDSPITIVVNEIFVLKSSRLSRVEVEINGQAQIVGTETTASWEIDGEGIITRL